MLHLQNKNKQGNCGQLLTLARTAAQSGVSPTFVKILTKGVFFYGWEGFLGKPAQ